MAAFSYRVMESTTSVNEVFVDYEFDNSSPKNVMINVIENPFTDDEDLILKEGVKFSNLMTVEP